MARLTFITLVVSFSVPRLRCRAAEQASRVCSEIMMSLGKIVMINNRARERGSTVLEYALLASLLAALVSYSAADIAKSSRLAFNRGGEGINAVKVMGGDRHWDPERSADVTHGTITPGSRH